MKFLHNRLTRNFRGMGRDRTADTRISGVPTVVLGFPSEYA
jgi:hypothetical protein